MCDSASIDQILPSRRVSVVLVKPPRRGGIDGNTNDVKLEHRAWRLVNALNASEYSSCKLTTVDKPPYSTYNSPGRRLPLRTTTALQRASLKPARHLRLKLSETRTKNTLHRNTIFLSQVSHVHFYCPIGQSPAKNHDNQKTPTDTTNSRDSPLTTSVNPTKLLRVI